MTGSWQDKYDAITPQAAALLRAMIVVEVSDPTELAAALGVDVAGVSNLFKELDEAGWTHSGTAHRLPEPARVWLAQDAADHVDADTLTADDADLASRYLDHHLTHLSLEQDGDATRWAVDHRDDIIAALQAGIRTNQLGQARALIDAAWPVAGEVDDPEWRRALTKAGERTARDHGELLTSLRRSADTALAYGDLAAADRYYGRAAGLAQDVGDGETAIAMLVVLARLLEQRRQPSRALTAYLELADLHRKAGNRTEFASTLAELATITLVGDRPQRAVNYLNQADTLLTEITAVQPSPETFELHARVLELRGRAQWALGKKTLARRSFLRAGTLLDKAASGNLPRQNPMRERLQTLSTLSRDEPLPPLDLPG